MVASRTANAVILADANWRIEWVNESFTRLFGHTLEEVRGRRPSQVLTGPGTEPPRPWRRWSAPTPRAEPSTGSCSDYDRNGREIWTEVETQGVRDEQGRLVGYMSMQLDTSERKRMQMELARTEAQVPLHLREVSGRDLIRPGPPRRDPRRQIRRTSGSRAFRAADSHDTGRYVRRHPPRRPRGPARGFPTSSTGARSSGSRLRSATSIPGPDRLGAVHDARVQRSRDPASSRR